MYNLEFIFEECGFHWLPAYIDPTLLFNVSFNVDTGSIKLYILNQDRTSLYKISDRKIVQQDLVQDHRCRHQQLSDFLGYLVNPQEIEIDTVENDTLYIFTEHASSREFMRFATVFMAQYGISKPDFVKAASQINKSTPTSIADCWSKKLISGFKVPLTAKNCKIYARPFKIGHSYTLNERTLSFLTRLYNCDISALAGYLQHMWVSLEFGTGRVMVTTQYHELVHKN